MSTLDEILDQLVIANRILAREGVLDAFGHVSVRNPENPEQYILSCSRSPELVEKDDLGIFTLQGDPVTKLDRKGYAERFIHGAVFEARPDVMAVVHSHSHEVIPFGVTGIAVRPLLHIGAPIGKNIPVWDIRARFGESSNMLVTNMEQGRDLASGLGDETVALMRGHGGVVVGEDLRKAVMTAIFLQVNAKIQMQAILMGGAESVSYLTDGEIEGAREAMLWSLSVDRAWDYWKRRAGF